MFGNKSVLKILLRNIVRKIMTKLVLNDLARNSKSLTIRGDVEINVYEVKLETAYGVLKTLKNRKEDDGFDLEEIVDFVLEKTNDFTDLPKDQFMKLTFSELKQVREAFKEVNADFLETLESIGLNLSAFQSKEEECKTE